jgi:MYXO-CTERM domain-containing protein
MAFGALLESFCPKGVKPMALGHRTLALVAALLLGMISRAPAADIKVVAPLGGESTEGNSSATDQPFPPFRYQQAFAAADFVALDGKPHWITSFTVRPDRGLSSPRTVTFPDQQVRLSTTATSPLSLSQQFDDNFGPDVTLVYRGPLTLVAGAGALTSVPRGFYETSLAMKPFLYDPSKGNLLLDMTAWGGMTPSTHEDKSSAPTALYAPDPNSATGTPTGASIVQFTFVPVPEPSAPLGAAVLFLATATRRRRRPEKRGKWPSE